MCSDHGDCGHSGRQCGCLENGPRIEGFLIPCLLLLLKAKSAHGYELMENLGHLDFFKAAPDPGVVYRHLRRLEDEGFVASQLEPGSGGPARKVYSLTSEGENYLLSWAASLRVLRASLDGFLTACSNCFPEVYKPI